MLVWGVLAARGANSEMQSEWRKFIRVCGTCSMLQLEQFLVDPCLLLVGSVLSKPQLLECVCKQGWHDLFSSAFRLVCTRWMTFSWPACSIRQPVTMNS